MANRPRSAFGTWRVAAVMVLATLAARCSLFVDSAGIAGGAKEDAAANDAESGDDARDARATDDATVGTDATSTNDAPSSTDARGDVDVDAGRDAMSIPDSAYVWPGNGHGYLVVTHDGGVSYDVAKQEAAALGGHLATIGSAAENQFVSDLSNNTDRAWDKTGGPFLGGYQPFGSTEPDGGWTWVTGEPWTYSNWAPSEPSGGFQEDYVQFEARFSAKWNDIASGAPNSFVVEFE